MTVDRRSLASSAGLVLVVVALYAQVAGHQFVNYDDPVHLSGNPLVNQGVTAAALRDAFLTAPASNWQPLTWISHMVVWQFAGERPAAHLLVNVALHALDAVLLLLALTALTRRWGPSLVVALLFAVHPLRVESVAWATERKDVLSGAFFLLTLWAYAGYARRPRPRAMMQVATALALGLLAKPMLVTTPVVLLLLDVWPLRRREPWRRLLLEKTPLFALALLASAATLLAQRSAVRELEAIDAGARLANAALSVWQYVGKAVWPAHLAVFYPFPTHFVAWQVILATLALVGVTAAAWRWRHRCPAVAVGWTWSLVMLLPVVGLVTVGNQALADRYTYLPHIGLAIAVVWPLADAFPRLGTRSRAVIAAAVVSAFAIVTWRQVAVWRDSRSLFEHALAVTDANHVAHLNLGVVDLDEGELAAARAHFEQVLRIQPGHPLAENDLGLVALREGNLAEASARFRRAADLKADYADAWDNLGWAMQQQGDLVAAEAHYRRALAVGGDHPTALQHLGSLLGQSGRLDEAETCLRRALALDAASTDAWINLGNVLFARGDLDAARDAYERAVAQTPAPEALYALGLLRARRGDEAGALVLLRRAADHPAASASVLSAVAWRLATHPQEAQRDGPAALGYAQRAVDQTAGRDPRALAALAAACAAVEHFDDAVLWQQRALEQTPPDSRGAFEPALRAYREGRVFVSP